MRNSTSIRVRLSDETGISGWLVRTTAEGGALGDAIRRLRLQLSSTCGRWGRKPVVVVLTGLTWMVGWILLAGVVGTRAAEKALEAEGN